MRLIVPNRHITNIADMQPSDWVAMGALFKQAVAENDIRGGGLVLRFGDPRFHSGTIPHLHFNILEPTGEPEYRIPLSKDEADRKKNYARLLSFRDELLKPGVRAKLFDVP
jgi:diadenosine tetraphosphate (Ap4A) HIT family hydrolase